MKIIKITEVPEVITIFETYEKYELVLNEFLKNPFIEMEIIESSSHIVNNTLFYSSIIKVNYTGKKEVEITDYRYFTFNDKF